MRPEVQAVTLLQSTCCCQHVDWTVSVAGQANSQEFGPPEPPGASESSPQAENASTETTIGKAIHVRMSPEYCRGLSRHRSM